jgi:hypothetical protein
MLPFVGDNSNIAIARSFLRDVNGSRTYHHEVHVSKQLLDEQVPPVITNDLVLGAESVLVLLCLEPPINCNRKSLRPQHFIH